MYGVDIIPGTLSSVKFPKNNFDVITMWDVLEHVPDPSKEIKDVNGLLKKGGLLCINYPDIGSLPSKIMGKRWVFLQDIHLWYFTPETITKLLKKHGFEILGFKRSWQYLSAGYLAHKIRNYSRTLSRILTRILKTTRLENLTVPYWLGQTTLVARKKK
jgi:2-polyprenyl-3-methyl-5-hydroxy-6-metoxy-1,4-benzoquinol methylase